MLSALALALSLNPVVEISAGEPARRDCSAQKLTLRSTDPLTNGAFSVNAYRYLPKARNSDGMVIYPRSGGLTPFDRQLGGAACKRGLPSIVLADWTGSDDKSIDLEVHDRGLVRGVWARRLAASALRLERFFVAGTSLGGLFASVVAGTDPRAAGAALTVAGASTHEMLLNSNLTVLRKLEKVRRKTWGWSREDYERAIRENVRFEVGTFARADRHRDIFFVLAEDDATVPTSTQEELWRLWGKPSVLRLKLDHLGAILWTGLFVRDEILDFAIDRFAR
jgi:hypothetical protein